MASAYKSRAKLESKDYTADLERQIADREFSRKQRLNTASMIGDAASGIAALSNAFSANAKSWEELEAGGQAIHKEQGFEGEFDLGKSLTQAGDYEGKITMFDKWFKQAPTYDRMMIGDKAFSTTEVSTIGKVQNLIGNPQRYLLNEATGQTSLYDVFGRYGDTGATVNVVGKKPG